MSRKLTIKVRVTTAEKVCIEELARETGYSSIGRYMRERALKATRSGPKHTIIREMVRIVNRLHALIEKPGKPSRDIQAEYLELSRQIRKFVEGM